jgi:hypothetical protein
MLSGTDTRLIMLLLGNAAFMIIAAFSGYTIGQVLWAYLIECWIITFFTALSYLYVGAKHESFKTGAVKAGSFLFLAALFLAAVDNAANLKGIVLDDAGFSALLLPAAAFLISHGVTFYESAIINHARLAETISKSRGAWSYLLIPILRLSPIFLVAILISLTWPAWGAYGLLGGYALATLFMLKTGADVMIYRLKKEFVFV